MGVFVITFLTACQGSGVEYDLNKQKAFESLFVVGSPQEDVEKIVMSLEGVEFSETFILSDGDIVIVYRTSLELYGTFAYSFIFSDDLKLKYIVAEEFTD